MITRALADTPPSTAEAAPQGLARDLPQSADLGQPAHNLENRIPVGPDARACLPRVEPNSLNVTSTSTLSPCSATEMALITECELRDPEPAVSWAMTEGAAQPTKRNISDTAEAIRIAAVDSAPFAALCRALRVRDRSGDAL